MPVPKGTSPTVLPALPWLAAGQAFPPLENAWNRADPAPGLLAAGHAVQAAGALPLYIRDKVAQTTAERAAVKTAQVAPA